MANRRSPETRAKLVELAELREFLGGKLNYGYIVRKRGGDTGGSIFGAGSGIECSLQLIFKSIPVDGEISINIPLKKIVSEEAFEEFLERRYQEIKKKVYAHFAGHHSPSHAAAGKALLNRFDDTAATLTKTRMLANIRRQLILTYANRDEVLQTLNLSSLPNGEAFASHMFIEKVPLTGNQNNRVLSFLSRVQQGQFKVSPKVHRLKTESGDGVVLSLSADVYFQKKLWVHISYAIPMVKLTDETLLALIRKAAEVFVQEYKKPDGLLADKLDIICEYTDFTPDALRSLISPSLEFYDEAWHEAGLLEYKMKIASIFRSHSFYIVGKEEVIKLREMNPEYANL